MLRKCLGFVIGTEIHRKNLVTRNTRYRFFKNFRWIVRTAQEKSPVSLIPVFCWVRMNSKRKIELKDSVWPLVRKKQGRNPKLSLKVKKANPWISRSSWSLIFYLLSLRVTKRIGPTLRNSYDEKIRYESCSSWKLHRLQRRSSLKKENKDPVLACFFTLVCANVF